MSNMNYEDVDKFIRFLPASSSPLSIALGDIKPVQEQNIIYNEYDLIPRLDMFPSGSSAPIVIKKLDFLRCPTAIVSTVTRRLHSPPFALSLHSLSIPISQILSVPDLMRNAAPSVEFLRLFHHEHSQKAYNNRGEFW